MAFVSVGAFARARHANQVVLSSRTTTVQVSSNRCRVMRMVADDGEQSDGGLEQGGMRDQVMQELKKTSRDYSPTDKPRARLGATIDEEGKGNIWAVEPKEDVSDKKPNFALLAVGAIVFFVPLRSAVGA